MNIAALIIGIDGWDQYTRPLVESIRRHEPDVLVTVIDNASETPYPTSANVYRTERLSYAQAINAAHNLTTPSDWYIVLSNDVLCNGPFSRILGDANLNEVLGPQIWHEHGLTWLVGWCVCIPAEIWQALNGWDEGYKMSSWEDVDLSVSAQKLGYIVRHCPGLPFRHLDQRQRFTLTADYWQSEAQNQAYFANKHRPVPHAN